MAKMLPLPSARVLFRPHIENGMMVSATLAMVAAIADFWLGAGPAVLASIGAMCVSIVD